MHRSDFTISEGHALDEVNLEVDAFLGERMHLPEPQA